jgi:hypothetical protein
VDDKVLGSVVELAGQIALDDGLGTLGVALLGVERGAGHVRHHGVTAAPGVGGVAQRVVLGGGLGEPDITSVAAEVSGLEGLGDVLLDDDGTTGGVDEPRAGLHLRDKVLVEETAGLLVQGAVDGDNITLGKHLLEVLNAAAADLLLNLRGQGLVVEVEQLLAVEGLKAAQHTLTDAANSDSADDLVLEVVLVLGGGSDIPVAGDDLLVSGDEVADQDQDGHDNVLSDRDNVGSRHLSDGDTTVGGVGSVEVDMVGTDTGRNGELQLLGLGQTLLGKVSRVEAVALLVLKDLSLSRRGAVEMVSDVRGGNNDLSVHQLLVESGVLALLIRCGDEGVTLVLQPLADAQFVLGGTQKIGLLQ